MGNFIVDHVKFVESWPEQDMLVDILREVRGGGGGPFNVLKNLAALGATFPLSAAGLLGDDDDGDWIRSECDALGFDTAQLRSTREAPTSYTDVMCVEESGRRTFFHHRGSSSDLSAADVDLEASSSRVLYLGYLLLLKEMDRIGSDGRTDASRLLETARNRGFITAVETVSVADPAYREVVVAALPFADLAFFNEVEASMILEEEIKPTSADLRSAVESIHRLGAGGRVIIHCSRGAVSREPDGSTAVQGAVEVPSDWIEGSTGAGDAFTAGYLFGVHEASETKLSLRQGVCAAAQSLSHSTASGGMRSMAECLALGDLFGYRSF